VFLWNWKSVAKPHKRKMKNDIGCPVGNHGRECCRGCGGWYRKYNREMMLRLLKENRLDPEKMPCGMLKEQARRLNKGELYL